MTQYKIVVVGSGGVGKTAITVQLTQDVFEDEYNPTIEETYTKEMTIDGEPFNLKILDTAGQEEYSVLRDQYWRSGDGFLLVYDITNESSYKEIANFFDMICKTNEVENFPIVVCANKCDLKDKRVITSGEGKELCEKMQWKFFETSAKDRINVEESFIELVREIKRFKGQVASGAPPATKRKPGFLKGLFKK